MMRTLAVSSLVSLLLSPLAWGAAQYDRQALQDLYFGEALFYAYQSEYFDAISRVDTELSQYYGVDEPQLDKLHFHINDAEFSVGDFELYYRMHRKAGRAIKAVIEGNVKPEVRNEALFRLAKIYFQKEQNLNALHAIERIQGDVPKRIENDISYLKGQIYMVNGRFEEAEKIFDSLTGEDSHQGYAVYNLGLSRMAQGNDKNAVSTLEHAGRISSDDRAVLAIKDKANLTLGSRLMDQKDYPSAAGFLERVRIEGPYSNRALLGLGWAHVSFEDYQKALVPWTILSKRHVTDPAVQDALLGVPFAYGKLGLFGRSALGYGHALSVISAELDRLDASITSIKDGKFLEALVRDEIKLDKNWVIKLRDLPETPETYYLMELMASHDFQSSLQNYFDLEQLRKKLELWSGYYSSYEEIIQLRKGYYEPLLPRIDEQFRKLDSLINLRLEQRDRISSRLQAMLVAPRPDFLATAPERIFLQSINAFEKSPSNNSADTQARVDRLKGVISWDTTVEYDERLTQAFENLAALDVDIARLRKIYESFVRARQAATQSYQGYDEQITRLRIKTERSLKSVENLMKRQGRMLEAMAISELQQRSQQLEASQIKARFAMAESYDRATMGKLEAAQQTAPQDDKASAPGATNTQGADGEQTQAPVAGGSQEGGQGQ